MKGKADLVCAWMRRAQSDFAVLEMCLQEQKSLDMACFHAQQAAGKYLKAYLIANEIEFPYIHNLEKLVQLCSERDAAFASIRAACGELTPYAVQARYDADFWPSLETVRLAWQAALAIKEFVVALLSPNRRKQGRKEA